MASKIAENLKELMSQGIKRKLSDISQPGNSPKRLPMPTNMDESDQLDEDIPFYGKLIFQKQLEIEASITYSSNFGNESATVKLLCKLCDLFAYGMSMVLTSRRPGTASSHLSLKISSRPMCFQVYLYSRSMVTTSM